MVLRKGAGGFVIDKNTEVLFTGTVLYRRYNFVIKPSLPNLVGKFERGVFPHCLLDAIAKEWAALIGATKFKNCTKNTMCAAVHKINKKNISLNRTGNDSKVQQFLTSSAVQQFIAMAEQFYQKCCPEEYKQLKLVRKVGSDIFHLFNLFAVNENVKMVAHTDMHDLKGVPSAIVVPITVFSGGFFRMNDYNCFVRLEKGSAFLFRSGEVRHHNIGYWKGTRLTIVLAIHNVVVKSGLQQ